MNEWMAHAAAVTGTVADHKPLILYGPTGSGKTDGVRVAAALHGLRCVWRGSDDDPVYLKAQATRLREAVLSRSLVPKILVIDDAEASLTCGGTSLKKEDFFRIAHGRLPTVVIAGPSLFDVPCLYKLPKDKVCMVKSVSLAVNDVCKMLQEEFHGRVDAAVVRRVVKERHGDVRGSRMDIASRFSESLNRLAAPPGEEDRWVKRVRAMDSVFDCVHAAFDMDGKTASREDLGTILKAHGNEAETLIATHYLAACPKGAFDEAVQCADMISQADAMGWSSEEASRFMRGVALTRVVKQARDGAGMSTEQKLNFKQPNQGHAGKRAQENLGKLSATLHDAWKLRMVEVGDATTTGHSWTHAGRNKTGDARSFWRQRDALIALADKVPKEEKKKRKASALRSIDELHEGALMETNRLLTKRPNAPWEVPKPATTTTKPVAAKKQTKLSF